MKELKEYLQKEFDRTVHRKYRHLFEQWFSKLTDNQIMYYTAQARQEKSICVTRRGVPRVRSV